MERRTSPLARILAAFALLAAALAVVVVISSATGGESSESAGQRSGQVANKQKQKQKQNRKRTRAKTYVVQSGDTLIAIARQTGVSVEELMTLNPEVDPQVLIEGEELKLR